MLTHHKIWSAIDKLAEKNNISVSALAKRAGLDPTTFNKSKRITGDGRPRWPSTESVSKILTATDSSIETFMALLSSQTAKPGRAIPLIGMAQAGGTHPFLSDGVPAVNQIDEIYFPDIRDDNAYALEISGDSMLPLYREGDVVIISPAAPVRRGDRVVVRTRKGELLAKILSRQTNDAIELKSMNSGFADRVLNTNEIAWVARVVWASQ